MGAFVYAVATADVVRLLRLRKRLQRSLSFVYAGMYPICAATSEVLLWMLCSQYCVNERKLRKNFLLYSYLMNHYQNHYLPMNRNLMSYYLRDP